MRRLAKKELVYLAMIRTTNDTRNDSIENDSRNEEPKKQCTITINDDQDKLRHSIPGRCRQF